MFQNQKTFSFEQGLVLVAVLINVLILKTAYTITKDLYWLLLLSVPLLTFAVYLKKRASKKALQNGKANSHDSRYYEKDSLNFSSIFFRNTDVLPKKEEDKVYGGAGWDVAKKSDWSP